jgi:hypothetical protein
MIVDLSQMTAEDIKAKLLADGAKLHTYRKNADAAAEALEAARKQWQEQPEVKALIDADEEAAKVKGETENNIRVMQTRLFELTGEKNPDPAFQIRVTAFPQYEPEKITKWFMGLFTSLFTINRTEVNDWLKSIADEDGLFPLLGDNHRIPAIIVNKPSPAIITSGIEKLATKPAPVADEPTAIDVKPILTPVGPMITMIPVTPEPDPVMDELEKVGEKISFLLKQDAHVPVAIPVHPGNDDLGDIPF